MNRAKNIIGWSIFMGMLSAGVTYWATHGDIGLTAIAFCMAAAITAVVGPSLTVFFKEWT